MENFINQFVNHSMPEFVAYLTEVKSSERDIDASVDWLTSEVDKLGGTVVLDCKDYGGDRALMISFERHYPDTINENRYCAIQITQDGYITEVEQGSFYACFDYLVDWTRTEVTSVA